MDVDSISAQDMRFNPPTFPLEEIAPVVAAGFGLQGQWQPLVGERDQNFRLQGQDGQCYVVKIAGPDEDPDVTDFQVQALLHLERHAPDLPVPRLVHTLAGDCLGEIRSAEGISHAVRVVTFLPGMPYADGTFPDAQHLFKVGAFMGGVVNALADFEHRASQHFMPWNLSNGVAVSRDMWAGAEEDARAVAEPLLPRLRSEVLPALNAGPSQVIHNDGHPENLLRADANSQAVSGLIDFGDMVYAPVINELAVTATTFQRVDMTDLSITGQLLAGFHQVHPLSDEEVSLLWDAMTLRLLITVLLSDVKRELEGAADHGALRDRTQALAMLVEINEMDHTAAVDSLRAVCGYC
jgi:Ser/Thr protein kinase RdoA (MazF antagonist)